jgi:acetylornithine deacetylase/succinyl-diaminopimelate desuccinylase-like protein
MYKILRDKNTLVADYAIDFARRLVKIPSPSLYEKKVAHEVEKGMTEIGYDKVFHDDYGNVVGIIFGRNAEPALLLNSHMDTVVPSGWDGCGIKPYGGGVEDGKLFGVGASDCKGGLAAQIFSGLLLKRSLLPLKGNLVVAATVAEENGLGVGIRALLDDTLPSLGMKPDYAILGEPTSLGIYHGHDGWLEMEIHVKGTNPFHVDEIAQSIMSDLRQLYSAQKTDAGDEAYQLEPPHYEDMGAVRCATLTLARRLAGTEDVGAVVSAVEHEISLVADGRKSVAVEVATKQDTQRLYTGRSLVVRHATRAWTTDPFHYMIDRARQTFAAGGHPFRPGRWRLSRLGMGTAGDVLVNKFGIPTIGYGPGSEEQAHNRFRGAGAQPGRIRGKRSHSTVRLRHRAHSA